MGSGALKTLSSDEVPHHQFLYVFSRGGHSSKPCVSLLLWGLSVCPRRYYWFFVTNTPIVNHRLTSLTSTWGPTLLGVAWFVPRMLGAVATQMSLFVAGVTLSKKEKSAKVTMKSKK